MQRNVTKAWIDNFDSFIADTELCHQVFLFEIGQFIFDGFLFTWKMIDDEFIKPENKNKYQKMTQEIKRRQAIQKATKHAVLAKKREDYIKREQEIIDKANAESEELDKQINEIGFALFGEKAKRKKDLIARKKSIDSTYDSRKVVLMQTKKNTDYCNHSFSFLTINCQKLEKYEVRDRAKFDVMYDENSRTYSLYDANGAKVYQSVKNLHLLVGAYKQFTATLSNVIISFGENGTSDIYEIFLKLTNDF